MNFDNGLNLVPPKREFDGHAHWDETYLIGTIDLDNPAADISLANAKLGMDYFTLRTISIIEL